MFKIGISGPAESGKSTLSKLLGETLGYKELKTVDYVQFAKPLKDFCIDYLGLTSWQVYTKEGKNSDTKYKCEYLTTKEFTFLFGLNYPRDYTQYLKSRHVLQLWAERFREWDEEFFVNKFIHSCWKIEQGYSDIIICDDWRYKNEALVFDYKIKIAAPIVMQTKSEIDLNDYVGVDITVKPRDAENSVQKIISDLKNRGNL